MQAAFDELATRKNADGSPHFADLMDVANQIMPLVGDEDCEALARAGHDPKPMGRGMGMQEELFVLPVDIVNEDREVPARAGHGPNPMGGMGMQEELFVLPVSIERRDEDVSKITGLVNNHGERGSIIFGFICYLAARV